VVGGVGALAKEVRVGTLAVSEKSSGRLLAQAAYKAITTIGKTSGRIGEIALLYVVITRPGLIASATGWIAEQFGINRLIGIFAVYFVVILLVLELLRPPIWCGLAIARSLRRLRSILAYRPRLVLRAQAA
jgi:hypothetical protein